MKLPTAVKTGPPSLLLQTHRDVTSEWLTELFDEPTTLTLVAPVGAGHVASTYRAKFTCADGTPGSVIIKLGAEDQGSRDFGSDYGAYQKEVDFYANLGHKIASQGVIPYAYASLSGEDGWFTIALEDITDGVVGDQMAGYDVPHMRRAFETLAKFHAPFVNSKELANSEWLTRAPKQQWAAEYKRLFPIFLERHKDRVAKEHLDVVAWLDNHVMEFMNIPLGTLDGLRHQDFRPDNIMFTPTRCLTFDFQGAGYGLLMHDAAFFLGGGCSAEVRRANEKELIKHYLDVMQEGTDVKIDRDVAWWQYRRQLLMQIWVVVVAGIFCVQTKRGDEMFATMCERAAQAIIDLKSQEIFEGPHPGRYE